MHIRTFVIYSSHVPDVLESQHRTYSFWKYIEHSSVNFLANLTWYPIILWSNDNPWIIKAERFRPHKTLVMTFSGIALLNSWRWPCFYLKENVCLEMLLKFGIFKRKERSLWLVLKVVINHCVKSVVQLVLGFEVGGSRLSQSMIFISG